VSSFCNDQCYKEPGFVCPRHTNRFFLEECHNSCTYSSSYGNRVVQRGLCIPIEVFWTGKKGWGLRSKQKIRKGTFVFEYVGEIVTNAELMQRRALGVLGKSEPFTLALDVDWISDQVTDDVTFYIDSTVIGNVNRFLNHRYLLELVPCVFNNVQSICTNLYKIY
jgi:SET domain-containing protein